MELFLLAFEFTYDVVVKFILLAWRQTAKEIFKGNGKTCLLVFCILSKFFKRSHT